LNETNRSRPKRKGDKWVLSIEGFEVVFTEREMQIIKMIVEGKTNKEMADELFLAEGRIRNIITEIISKMMVKDRTQLAVYALKNHIFD
jgi:DNA-binding NarL/FixJ family response regulator